jgi:hypothetical protein
MSTRTNEKLPPICEVSHEEPREIVDRQTRICLGISGDEFIRRYEAGKISDEDLDLDPEVVLLVMMMPVDRQAE